MNAVLMILLVSPYQPAMGEKDMIEACGREIIELHQFFQQWFKAELPAGDSSRFSGVMAQDFRMVTPDGKLLERKVLVPAIHNAYGQYSDKPFVIEIRNITVRSIGEGLLLATYEEWQNKGDGMRGRLSSALFREAPNAPNKLAWAHVHETWLP